MKFLRWLLPVLSSVVLAQNVTIPNLPAAGAIVGTETIPLYQSGSCSATSGTCNTTPAALFTYMAAHGLAPASPSNSVQFNNAGVFGGTSNMTWDNTNGVLQLTGPFGGVLGSVTGQSLTLNGGNAITDTTPAVIVLQPGDGANGGGLIATSGNAVGTGAGAPIQFNAGNGVGTNEGGGPVTFGAGNSTGTATSGIVSFSTHGVNRLTFLENGVWNVNGLAGSAGNVLSSNGPGSVPTWGPLGIAAMPALTGDCTTTAGTVATTCTKTSGVAFGPAATIATDTGTGPVVLQTSPTLVTPALGTPSAINLANATNLPAAALPAFTGDVTTTAGTTTTTIAANAVTNAKAAQMVTSTIKCSNTGSTANPQDCNPLPVANMIGAVLSVDVAATANITLSGIQTLDGQSGFAGEVVAVMAESSSVNDGFYIMSAGAWPRAGNFKSGDIINQFCNLSVFIEKGTAEGGLHWRLVTSSANITVGITGQSWVRAPYANASTTVRGVATVTSTSTSPNASMVASPTSVGGATFDCVFFQDANGSVGDGNALSNFGPCAITDAGGHLLTTNASGSAPSSSVGTISTDSTDNRGRVTAITATTSITITFRSNFPYTPACGGSTSSAGLGAVVGVTAVSPSAVTFGMASLTGSFNFWCW